MAGAAGSSGAARRARRHGRARLPTRNRPGWRSGRRPLLRRSLRRPVSSSGLPGRRLLRVARLGCPLSARSRPLRTAGNSPPPGSVSTVMIGVPTSTVTPGCTSSWWTRPAKGDGSSTAAFAVSISTITWLTVSTSPTATRQPRISASVSPSPTSGIEKVCKPSGCRAIDHCRHAASVVRATERVSTPASGRPRPTPCPGRAGSSPRAGSAGTGYRIRPPGSPARQASRTPPR